MGLTSWPLAVLVTVVAVGVLLGSTFWVPRVLQRRARVGLAGVALQGLAVLLSIVMMLATTAVWVNREAGAFPSWSSLLSGPGAVSREEVGAAPSTVLASAAARKRLQHAQEMPVPPELQAPSIPGTSALPAHEAPPSADDAGTWLRVQVPSDAGVPQPAVDIRLPAGYFEHPEARYPVITAFSGIPGSPLAFRRAFDLGPRLQQLAADGQMREPIVVIPDVYPGHSDTECVDRSDGGPRYETWVARDVTGWVRDHLRVIDDPAAMATLGYSAGGWCAAMFAVKYPQLWGSAVVLSGYFRPVHPAGQEWTAPGDPRYDLPAILALSLIHI